MIVAGKIGEVMAREFREALPATIFFLFLFHMIGLTKAVALDEFSFTALRAAGATVGALIVAKAILLVEALPIARRLAGRLIYQVLWKTLLYGLVALAFRVVEELVPLVSKHGGVAAGAKAMLEEVSWPLFAVLGAWTLGGLFLYCLAAELVRSVGKDRVKKILFEQRAGGAAC
ncbi:MAG TPA: hypothetical protein VF876_04200 [Burkholderiales bacterium]